MTLTRLGWLCANHPWRVLATWAIVVAAIVGLAAGVGARPQDDFNAPRTPTEYSALTNRWPAAGGTEARVVVRKPTGRLAPAELAVLRDRLRGMPGVSAVSTERMSTAGDVALVNVLYDVPINDIPGASGVDALRQAIAPVQRSGLQIELGGEVPENYTADGGPLERAATHRGRLPLRGGLRVGGRCRYRFRRTGIGRRHRSCTDVHPRWSGRGHQHRGTHDRDDSRLRRWRRLRLAVSVALPRTSPARP